MCYAFFSEHTSGRLLIHLQVLLEVTGPGLFVELVHLQAGGVRGCRMVHLAGEGRAEAVDAPAAIWQFALEGAVRALKPGGRIAVITFHSLEDRPVKWFFKNHENILEILTKKPIEPEPGECEANPPSRSAKLRVVEKLEKERDPLKKRNKYRAD